MMDGFAVGLSLLIAGAVIAFLAWPWRVQREGLLAESELEASLAPRETLDERYEAVLTALRDLDFDHALSKVAEKDYAPLRQALLMEAADIMAQLDEQVAAENELSMRLEAEILALRQTWTAESGGGIPARSLTSEGACPNCGRTPHPGDLYCVGCGTKLSLSCPERVS